MSTLCQYASLTQTQTGDKMRTYYRICRPADLTLSGKMETRIQVRKPQDHDLHGGDQVFTLSAENIGSARQAGKRTWIRKPTLEL